MIFYLHYILLTSGLSGISVLLGVYLKNYSDASQTEIGFLLMSIPFICTLSGFIFCSLADRKQTHRKYLINSLLVLLLGFTPHVIIPFFPEFYTKSARLSWYILSSGTLIGRTGLMVAWMMGESLAINYCQKSDTPYSRVRLAGTLSWGIYGYLVGQINDMPSLPLYVPAMILLMMSVVALIVVVLLWNKDDLTMKPMEPEGLIMLPETGEPLLNQTDLESVKGKSAGEVVELKVISAPSQAAPSDNDTTKSHVAHLSASKLSLDTPIKDRTQKNPQKRLFKMIFCKDGRVIKYMILFFMAGFFFGPLNFLLLNLEDLCKTRDCNFSNLAGYILVSQAACETLVFFILPWILPHINRAFAMSVAFFILFARYFFYGQYFFTETMSTNWVLLVEWGHGISYSIVMTIVADVSLIFANEVVLFMPELRRLGFLSNPRKCTKEKIEAQEKSIKLALKATFQAINSGAVEGFGNGSANLMCGLVVSAFSYVVLWQSLYIMAFVTLVLFVLVEISGCRFSDSYKPKAGTKAYEIIHGPQLSARQDKPLKQQQQQIHQQPNEEQSSISPPQNQPVV